MRSATQSWPARRRILKEIVQGKLETKTRTVLLGYAQRAAEHCASLTDANNAFACGEAAVRAAVEGQSGYMVKIVRNTEPDGQVKWSTGLQPLADIANVEHFVPRDWISEDGFLPNEKFVAYAQPLIEAKSNSRSKLACPSTWRLRRARWRRNSLCAASTAMSRLPHTHQGSKLGRRKRQARPRPKSPLRGKG